MMTWRTLSPSEHSLHPYRIHVSRLPCGPSCRVYFLGQLIGRARSLKDAKAIAETALAGCRPKGLGA